MVIQPLSTRLIKPNFCFDLSHRRSTTVSLETRNSLNSDLGCFTETWLCDSSNPNNLQIPSNYFIARSRNNGMLNCGVGLYVKHGIQYMTPEHIHNGDFEALWVWLCLRIQAQATYRQSNARRQNPPSRS